MTASAQPRLTYFADPMCSWCWGFTPVIEAIRDRYVDTLQLALMMGGLRPGTTEALTESDREDVLHHWHEVAERSGQPFLFDGALPAGFVYDTEPASRAVITVSELAAELTFAYFKAVQSAFYAYGGDVVSPDTLAGLAEILKIDRDEFLTTFNAHNTRLLTQAHVYRSRQLGVRGFPTLLLSHADQHVLLSNGYCESEPLCQAIDNYLIIFAEADAAG